MTNTGGTPAGWYYAPGDPEGTHRYWDGAQWIGDPQPLPQQQTPPAASAPPTDDMTVQYRPPTQESVPPTTGFDAPDYSTPGIPQSGGFPPNYGAPSYQSDAPASAGPGTPAEWGTRAIALLIDWGIGVGIFLAGLVLALIAGVVVEAAFFVFLVASYIAVIAYTIWNYCFRQGTTGQSIGKEKQGIKLVKDETGQPVGAGMAFVRLLLAQAISGATCGIYGILDYLWPLWDDDKKRLTDKMVTMSVITV